MILIGLWLRHAHLINFRDLSQKFGLLCCVLVLIFGCEYTHFSEGDQRTQTKHSLVLKRATFAELNGWKLDNHLEALKAFVLSCDVFMRVPEKIPFKNINETARVAWEQVCRRRLSEEIDSNLEAQLFFETWFQPYAVYSDGRQKGLFTGYFEPELFGSLQPTGTFRYPLYARPKDLIEVYLGQFANKYKNERIAGRVVKGKLQPYLSRAEIEKGALKGQGLELVWVDNPIDAFFLHVQGSGRVRLRDGSYRRLSYAGNNGHPYFAIGSSLVARGILSKEQVNMGSIRRWLEKNSHQARDIMDENPRFIFFKWLSDENKNGGPLGAQGVPLTAKRSLAVDLRFLPLGVPLWVETVLPFEDSKTEKSFHRLMVTQDTGGAIRGAVRGDIFWGSGENAGNVAGRMKHQGQYWLLLPGKLDVGVLVN